MDMFQVRDYRARYCGRPRDRFRALRPASELVRNTKHFVRNGLGCQTECDGLIHVIHLAANAVDPIIQYVSELLHALKPGQIGVDPLKYASRVLND